jgi:hypothetical protein
MGRHLKRFAVAERCFEILLSNSAMINARILAIGLVLSGCTHGDGVNELAGGEFSVSVVADYFHPASSELEAQSLARGYCDRMGLEFQAIASSPIPESGVPIITDSKYIIPQYTIIFDCVGHPPTTPPPP